MSHFLESTLFDFSKNQTVSELMHLQCLPSPGNVISISGGPIYRVVNIQFVIPKDSFRELPKYVIHVEEYKDN